MTRWARRLAYAVGAASALGAAACMAMAVLAPTVEQTWAWAVPSYVFAGCAALLLSQAGHLR